MEVYIYIAKSYIFIMNTSFNGNEKAFPYRQFVFDVYNRGIHTGIYIYVMRPPWVQHPILWAKQWYPVAIGRDLNCHLANFLGYILREVVYFVLAKFHWVFAGYQILHLSFVHLGSRHWDYYWWILNHPAAVIRSNIVKVELLAFLLLSFGGSTTFSSFIPIVPQDFFGRQVFIIHF